MLVQSILHVARESGTDVSEASVSFVEHQLMQSLHKTVEAQTEGVFDAEKWQQIVRIVGDSLKNHALMMDMFKEHGIKPKKPFDGEAVAREMRSSSGFHRGRSRRRCRCRWILRSMSDREQGVGNAAKDKAGVALIPLSHKGAA